MLYEKEIIFVYKGNRDYVTGADIFDSILKTVKEYFQYFPEQIKGSFHRLLRNNGILRIFSEAIQFDPEISYANFSIDLDSRIYHLGLMKTDSQPTSSCAYDESMVIENMTLEKEAVRMVVKSSYTYIEQIIAMNKILHLTLYSDTKKQWLFTKIDIKDVIDPSLYPGRELAIKVIKNFHNRLTQSAVRLDNKLLGNVWFSQAV